jgi:hypothetical protein
VSRALAPLLLAACASSNAGGSDAGRDAHVYLDAPGPDAAVPISLNETGDTTVNGGPTTCVDGNAMSPTYGNSYDNTWYRAFQLSDFPQISGGMHISSIEFGVTSATNAGMVTVKLGLYAGAVGGTTIDLQMITLLASATAAPPNTSTGEIVNVPIDANIPPGGKFVVEVVAPSVVTTGRFYLGGTTSAESHPGYWSSTTCGHATPIVATGSHEIMTIAGTH